MSKKTKETEVYQVPTEKEFANNLAEVFLKENNLALGEKETSTTLDVILSVPEVHEQFTLWLCETLYQNAFEVDGAPEGVALH